MRYTHILFDADNTLFDFNEAERRALTELLGELGIDATEENIDLYHRINEGWWKRLERSEVTFEQLVYGRMADFLAVTSPETDPLGPSGQIVHYLAKHSILFEGAEALLARLQPHFDMYIITNGSAIVQHSRMDTSPVSRYVKGIFISEELGVRKPSAEYFEKVLDAIGNPDKSGILVVGDSLSSDIQGGINAGLDTCWLSWEGGSAGELEPTYTTHSLEQTGDIILGEAE